MGPAGPCRRETYGCPLDAPLPFTIPPIPPSLKKEGGAPPTATGPRELGAPREGARRGTGVARGTAGEELEERSPLASPSLGEAGPACAASAKPGR